MDKSKEIDMEAVGLQWEKMIKNQPVDENVVSSIILKSWHRSALAGVNPYALDEKYYLKKKDLDSYSVCNKFVDEEFRSILQKIADEFNLSFILLIISVI